MPRDTMGTRDLTTLSIGRFEGILNITSGIVELSYEDHL
jgi:hypothetical protein